MTVDQLLDRLSFCNPTFDIFVDGKNKHMSVQELIDAFEDIPNHYGAMYQDDDIIDLTVRKETVSIGMETGIEIEYVDLTTNKEGK